MFKNKALRLVAGMLFGSAGGVLWGVAYQGAKSMAFGPRDEVAAMNALLNAIMLGSIVGIVLGAVVGLARSPLLTGVAVGLVSVVAVFLPAGAPFGSASSLPEGILKAGGLLLVIGLACALLLRPRSPAIRT